MSPGSSRSTIAGVDSLSGEVQVSLGKLALPVPRNRAPGASCDSAKTFVVKASASGKTLPHDQVIAAFDTNLAPGEVSWAEVEKVFAGGFEQFQAAAGEAAMKLLEERATADTRTRQKFATVLREDATRYRADRLAQIDLEEKQAQAIEEKQSQQLQQEREGLM